jgi:hypothetical protein
MGGIILTTSPTPKEVRFRLLQLCAALAVAQPTILKTVVFDTAAQLTLAGSPASGVVLGECKLTAGDLPALAGVTVGAVDQWRGAGTRQGEETRNYQLEVLFYQLCDNSMAEQIAALDVLWSKLSELPDYFANHVDRLRLGASGLGNLEALGRMTDGGTEDPINWQGGVYSHALYTLPVTTKRATRS